MGTVTLVRATHHQNAPSAMLVTLLPIVTLVRLQHSRNASLLILVTLFGIVTLIKVQSTNAPCLMLVTGRKLIVLGMATATPPGPVYPVMVIVPLFVM